MIEQGTELLLFRFGNYARYDFIAEHKEVIKKNGYVWLLKSGRKSNEQKIKDIIEQGGGLILKQPKSEGGRYFLCTFVEVSDKKPSDGTYPNYYEEFIRDTFAQEQWFKITKIEDMRQEDVEKIVLCKNENRVVDIIGTTMTSVMFVKNVKTIH